MKPIGINNTFTPTNPTDAAPVNPVTPAPALGLSTGVGGYPPNINTNELLLQLMQQQQKEKEEREKKELAKEIEKLKEERMLSEMRNIKDVVMATKSQGNINVNTNVNNQNQNTLGGNVPITYQQVSYSNRLVIDGCMWFVFLLLNLCFGGVGTILAGVYYGHTAMNGIDRRGELVCRGIIQILCFPCFFFGNIWGFVEAVHSFESGHCC